MLIIMLTKRENSGKLANRKPVDNDYRLSNRVKYACQTLTHTHKEIEVNQANVYNYYHLFKKGMFCLPWC